MEPSERELLLNRALDGERDADGGQARADDPAEAAWLADCERIAEALRPPSRAGVEALVDAAIARIAAEPPPAWAAPAPVGWRRRLPWLLLPLAAAAGLAAGIWLGLGWAEQGAVPDAPRIVYLPAPSSSAPAPAPQPLGRLLLATGAPQLREPGGERWREARVGDPIWPGSRIRTQDDRKAELQLSCGSAVRLDSDSELICVAPRELKLARGNAWSQVAPGEAPMALRTPHAKLSTEDSEVGLAVDSLSTSVAVYRGRAQLLDGERTVELTPRQGGRVERPGSCQTWSLDRRAGPSQRWMADLLYLHGREHPELVRQVDELLAQLGHAKMTYLSEAEIRKMGRSCVVPLARYLAQPARGSRLQRRLAARVLADLADRAVIDDLLALIGDADGEVRRAAGRGYWRLRGGLGGRALERELRIWAEGSAEARAAHRARLARGDAGGGGPWK